MPDPTPSPAVTPSHSLLGGAENMKLLFDDTMADLSAARKAAARHADAWESLRYRMAQDAQSFSHAVNMGTILSGQAGATEAQQSVSPIRTGTGDTVAAASYPANRAVDTSSASVAAAAAGIATANEAVSAAVANFLNSITALLAAATGKGASQASS